MLNLSVRVFLCPEWDVFSLGNRFSYCVVWWGIVFSSLARVLYINRQHFRKTIPLGEGNNQIIVYLLSNMHKNLEIC